MTANNQVVVAVDLGGTTMQGAVVDTIGTVRAKETRPTPKDAVVPALVDLFAVLRRHARDAGTEVVSAGVVTPGIVDESTGVVAYASNLGWNNMPLRRMLREALALPVGIGHDVRSAGRVEALVGAARNEPDFVHVMIGTGVAAALVINGETVLGADGIAGEFGHIPLAIDGEPCVCGQRGCLEVYASGAGVARRYAAATGTRRSSREIVGRLHSDLAANIVWREAVSALAQGLTIVTLLLDPACIVIGGGFAQAGAALSVPLAGKVRAGLAWRSPPRIVLSALDGRAGYLAAGLAAFRALGREDLARTWARTGD